MTFLIFSCNEKDNSFAKEKKYEKINFYNKDSFDLRIENFLSQYKSSDNFALIDYGTCARCSDDKVDNFFYDLSKNEKITIIFNDSVVFYKFNQSYSNVEWNYISSEHWKKMHLESSAIVRYKRLSNDHLTRLE
jgi:hypothetical protein